jgi:hypothetical protein
MAVSYEPAMLLKTCLTAQEAVTKMKSFEFELVQKAEELKDAIRSVDLWSPCSELTPDDHSIKNYEESIPLLDKARSAYNQQIEFCKKKRQQLEAIHLTFSWRLVDNTCLVYGVNVLGFNFAVAEFFDDFPSSLNF